MRTIVGLERKTLSGLKNTQQLLGCKSLDETLLLLCDAMKILYYAYQENIQTGEGYESNSSGSERKVNGNTPRPCSAGNL